MALERDDVGAAIAILAKRLVATAAASLEPAALGLADASWSRSSPIWIARSTTRASSVALSSLQPLDRARAVDPAVDAREQHLEVERLEDHVVGAGLIGADRARRARTCR